MVQCVFSSWAYVPSNVGGTRHVSPGGSLGGQQLRSPIPRHPGAVESPTNDRRNILKAGGMPDTQFNRIKSDYFSDARSTNMICFYLV
jgi:hypothetical protein